MTKAAIIKLSDYKQRMQSSGTDDGARMQSERAEKLVKDSMEVDKKGLTATEILNANLVNLTKAIQEQNKAGQISDKAGGVKAYGGAKGAIKERVDNIKDFFTLRGFLDKTGIVERGSKGFLGGIADAALEKREARQQYVKDRLNVDKNYVKGIGGGVDKASQTFAKQFDVGQESLISVQNNKKEMDRLAAAGFTPDQIARSTEAKQQAGLEADLAKKDSRFRILGGPAMEKAPKATRDNVVPFKSDDTTTSEEEVENLRLMNDQTSILAKIEENTRPVAANKGGDDKEKTKGMFEGLTGGMGGFVKRMIGSIGSVLSSIGGLIVDGLVGAFKFLFNPRMLLKLLTKVALPVMIVGSLVNGIIDGFKAFAETGSIGEALIAGLGGVLEFLTFGLIDKDTIKAVSDWIGGFVDDFIIKPVKDFIGFIGKSFDEYIAKPLTKAFEWVGGVMDEYIVQPIKDFFAPVGDFFKNISDGIKGFFDNFEIPGFSIMGKQFGPWHPFKKEPAASTESSPANDQKFVQYSQQRATGDMMAKEASDKETGNQSKSYKAEVAKKTTDLAAANPEMEKRYQLDKSNLKPIKTEAELKKELLSDSPNVTVDKKLLADKVSADSKAIEAAKSTPPAPVAPTIIQQNNSNTSRQTTQISSPQPRNYENPINEFVRKRAYG